ncbi:ribosomal protein L4 domain-containing protein [Boletus reticuloceps]|uniref:Large ribosomal subunit protein uL4m n=1 Tax=Boletus reticuloceps TaxID=495285 RepID=A0A8I2YXJ4_9AGAM|nr:ribosomal protein L4 domain-containing protein [Boletus reticuloceps]
MAANNSHDPTMVIFASCILVLPTTPKCSQPFARQPAKNVTQRPQHFPGLVRAFAAALPVPGQERRGPLLVSLGYTSLTPGSAIDPVEPVFLTLSSLQGKNTRDKAVALDPTVFNHPIRHDILHLCAVHHLDSLRQGSANTKTRAEVRGSGRKIRPQKGTGRARLGDGQSPMLRGGGVAFGPKPRDFSTKLNRKVIEMGMRVALSVKLKEQRLGVVPRIKWYCHKTITLKNRLETLGWRTGTLFVSGLPQMDAAIQRAGRNLRGLEFRHADEVNVYDLVKWRRVVLDLPAVALLESKLGRKHVERPGLSAAVDSKHVMDV